MRQTIGFCKASDGTRLAYAVAGDGPNLVRAGTWMTHVELDQDSTGWAHWWRELARSHRFVRYDQRGSGLSDWAPADFSFEARVGDLEAVVDALELDSFVLLGQSHGAPTAIEYTARHPERVSKLVIFGGFARGGLKRGGASAEREAQLVLMRNGWDDDNPGFRSMFSARVAPDASQDQLRSFDSMMRASSNGENAALIAVESSRIDVVDRLQQIETEALVVHCANEVSVPIGEGRLIANMLPHATMVELDSRNHMLTETEPAWVQFQDELREFVGEDPRPSEERSARKVTYPSGLSDREVEILRLIAEGGTDREIAVRLAISTRTVGNHVGRILEKTGSASRTQAVASLARLGIV